ncbi:hypothetical protein FGO68_gene401 [Halteria grandinella]|uniref:Transmembrane protein n=1 Tax=Halteria grandinella TaxID=5974 RepID=A0A8J8NI65_HALGN|nr:hypothetical protein FGO68_gene401 [Halteria grandinella]
MLKLLRLSSVSQHPYSKSTFYHPPSSRCFTHKPEQQPNPQEPATNQPEPTKPIPSIDNDDDMPKQRVRTLGQKLLDWLFIFGMSAWYGFLIIWSLFWTGIYIYLYGLPFQKSIMRWYNKKKEQ